MATINRLRHQGIDWQLFPAEEVLTTKEQFKQAAEEGRPDFIRLIKTSGPPELLSSRLVRASLYFGRIAQLCDVKIVPYTWGLCEDTIEIPIKYHATPGLLPEGYLPAAKVSTIRTIGDGKLPPERLERFTAGADAYLEEIAAQDTTRTFKDIAVRQLIYGHRLDNSDTTPDVWFADPDAFAGREEFPLATLPGGAFTKLSLALGDHVIPDWR